MYVCMCAFAPREHAIGVNWSWQHLRCLRECHRREHCHELALIKRNQFKYSTKLLSSGTLEGVIFYIVYTRVRLGRIYRNIGVNCGAARRALWCLFVLNCVRFNIKRVYFLKAYIPLRRWLQYIFHYNNIRTRTSIHI